jgi:hypothetical protein
MSTIVTRAGKGSPLTNTEVDSNFTNLNTDKLESDGSVLADKIAFDTTAALTPTTGQLVWDADTGTVDIGLNGATAPVMSVGEDQFYRVINQTGSTIAKGTLVMAAGTVGNSGKIKVAPWNGAQPSKTIMGLVMAAIPTEVDPTESGLGYVLAFGKVSGIQTNGANYGETWVNGDIIYAGASSGLTKTLPAAPNTKTTIAIVISAHASNGTLFVRPSYGSSLGEDELVQLSGLANADVLSYDSTDGRFENKTLSAAGIYATSNPAGYTTNTGTVTSVGGTGTVNGITLTGTVTSSGNLTLGGTLSGVNLTSQVTGTLPIANGGTGSTSTTYVNLTTNVTGTLPVANGGTGQTSYTNGQLLIGNSTGNTLAKATLTAGSGITITNGAGAVTIAATGGAGTVTSVGGTGTVNGITLTGTVTSSGNLTLGGTLSGVSLTTQVTGTLPVANGGTGITSFGAGVAAFLGTPTSANLAAAVTNETGSGALVFATSPTLVTPALGTPSALVGTNITGTAAGLTAGKVTTNANLTGAITSIGNAASLGSFTSANLSAALTDETGSGAAVFATSPTLVTPALGTPSSATLTNATGLPIVTGTTGTLSVARGGTGLTALGTAGQVLAVNSGATALEYTTAGGGSAPDFLLFAQGII